jgi:15-cis-phytoene synthase
MSASANEVSLGARVCRRITRDHARTFYLASHGLPRSVRAHAYAVYGFCRWADDGVDCARDVEQAARRLDVAREALESAYGYGPLPAGLGEFRRTVRSRGIPKGLFQDLLDGMAMDLTIHRYDDFPALDVYCYRVAGVVGLMMAHVFGFRHDRCRPHAEALGTAMQLTNILRDVREDSDRGRIYLPLDEMGRFGVSETQIAEGRADDRFGELMKFQIARARRYYQDAERGIPDLIGASSRLTVRLMGRMYAGILGEIERLNFDVFQKRASVSKRRKAMIVARCAWETFAETMRMT